MTASVWTPDSQIIPQVNANSTLVSQVFTPTDGQTLFILTNFQYVLGTNSLLVFINGVFQTITVDFTETSVSSFTIIGNTLTAANDKVLALGFVGVTAAITGTAANVAYATTTLADILLNHTDTTVNSYPQLRTLQHIYWSFAYLTGAGTKGDGLGGGFYYYDATDTTSADNGSTIIVAADGGRWKLLPGLVRASQLIMDAPLALVAGSTVPTQAAGNNSIAVASTAYTDGAVAAKAGNTRQVVTYGSVNSSGYANMLSAGTGLTLNLAATTIPMRINFAAGLFDFISTLIADSLAVVTLSSNNLSFISADYVTTNSVTWSSTLAPPQYGYSYNQAAQSVLQFNGAAGTTVILDDFGNTWTAQGGAKIQTNQIKFGTGALGGSGTLNALNGTTDYIQSNITTPSSNGGSWTIRAYVYLTAYSSVSSVFGGTSGINQGLYINGTGKCVLILSSASSNDIVNSVAGTATVPLNTWTLIECTYDLVSGKYFTYVAGIVDITVASALKIGSWGLIGFGVHYASGLGHGTGYIDKPEILPYCQHPNGVTYTVPTQTPNITTQGYASDFFSIPNMLMYQMSSPSTAAGINPGFTPKNRHYVGETITGATTITSVVNYAINGKYYIRSVGIQSISTRTLYSSNIGTNLTKYTINIINKISEFGYTPGNRVPFTTYGTPIIFPPIQYIDRNTIALATGQSNSAIVLSPASAPATNSSPTVTSWDTEIKIERDF